MSLSLAPVRLASASTARARMLEAAGVAVEIAPVRIDETAAIASLRAEGHSPRDIADALAELKTLKAAQTAPPGRLILGADQILACDDQILEKPGTRAAAAAQLALLAGRRHDLFSAACLARDGAIIWRHVGGARLWMRPLSPAWIEAYLDEAGPAILDCVGAYQVEARGAQLMTRLEGDLFTIQGLPLLPLLDALRTQGALRS